MNVSNDDASCRINGVEVAISKPYLMISQGVILDSTSQREAKRGQSTNWKGEMSRGALKLKRNLNVTIA
jgi:hypothetical protein